VIVLDQWSSRSGLEDKEMTNMDMVHKIPVEPRKPIPWFERLFVKSNDAHPEKRPIHVEDGDRDNKLAFNRASAFSLVERLTR